MKVFRMPYDGEQITDSIRARDPSRDSGATVERYFCALNRMSQFSTFEGQ